MPIKITKTLTADEQQLATTEGTKIYRHKKEVCRRHKWNRPDETTLENVIVETASEIACGAAIGIPWKLKTYEEDKRGDLAPGVQVRYTPYKTGRLLLHPWSFGGKDDTDNEFDRFYLVTGKFPVFTIRGSIMCWRAVDFVGVVLTLQENRPCLTVEQDKLDLIDLENPSLIELPPAPPLLPRATPKKNWTTPELICWNYIDAPNSLAILPAPK